MPRKRIRLFGALLASLLLLSLVQADDAPPAAPTEAELHAAILAANPEYAGDALFRQREGVLWTISLMKCQGVTTTAPLAKFDLSTLRSAVCYMAVNLEDLSGFAGATRLEQMNIERCFKVKDLTPLRGLTFGWLRMYGLPEVTTIEPLADLPLWHLDMGKCPKLVDLAPLAKMPLKELRMDDCSQVADISILREKPDLRELSIFGCSAITDYSPIADLKLETLLISPELLTARDREMVRGMATLKILATNWVEWKAKMSPELFWKKYGNVPPKAE